MIYVLINQMSQLPDGPGRVLSVHRTIEAAEAADHRLQRLIKKNNGENSYLPTIIVAVIRRVRKGDFVHNNEIVTAL